MAMTLQDFCKEILIGVPPELSRQERYVYLRDVAVLAIRHFGKAEGKKVFDLVLEKIKMDERIIYDELSREEAKDYMQTMIDSLESSGVQINQEAA
jgi:hypothetical protein